MWSFYFGKRNYNEWNWWLMESQYLFVIQQGDQVPPPLSQPTHNNPELQQFSSGSTVAGCGVADFLLVSLKMLNSPSLDTDKSAKSWKSCGLVTDPWIIRPLLITSGPASPASQLLISDNILAGNELQNNLEIKQFLLWWSLFRNCCKKSDFCFAFIIDYRWN